MSDMLGVVVRMLFSLGVVLALMYVAARLLGRTRGMSGGRRLRSVPSRSKGRGGLAAVGHSVQRARRARRSASPEAELELLARQPLGKTASVAVVRVANRTLLLGVTDTAVRLLSELDAALADDEEADDEKPALRAPVDLQAVVGLGVADSGLRARSASASMLDQLRERTVRRA